MRQRPVEGQCVMHCGAANPIEWDTARYSKNGHDEDMNDWPVLFLLQLSMRLAAFPVLLSVTDCAASVLAYLCNELLTSKNIAW